MGTAYRVRVVAPAQDEETIRGLIEERLAAVDQAMSTWRADSEVSRFNGLRAGESLVFSEDTWSVLELAWRVRDESGGAFDPTVGPLVDAWGFGAAGRSDQPAPPTADRAAELLQAVSAVTLSPPLRRATKLHDGAALDLSAVAKGWAVDQVSEALSAAGNAHHLVEVGGEIRTAGPGPGGTPWRIAVERPPTDASRSRPPAGAANRALPAGLHKVLPMTDGALATSGDYRNYRERSGVRYSHTIDPRTGRPVHHSLASASVFHPSCAAADAYATALMVLGPEEGITWADRNDLAALLLIYRGNGLEERTSAAFRRRFGAGRR